MGNASQGEGGGVMDQSRIGSLIEAAMNTGIGFVVALASQIVVFPLFGIYVPLSTNFGIGAWFTAISVIRSYIVRRWFNARLHAAAMRIASTQPKDQP